jgi:hypothetical protein
MRCNGHNPEEILPNANIKRMLPGISDVPAYSKDLVIGDDDLTLTVHEVADAALGEPGVGLKLTSRSGKTREMMQAILVAYLAGSWDTVQIDSFGQWWQVVLENGSFIRICG